MNSKHILEPADNILACITYNILDCIPSLLDAFTDAFKYILACFDYLTVSNLIFDVIELFKADEAVPRFDTGRKTLRPGRFLQ